MVRAGEPESAFVEQNSPLKDPPITPLVKQNYLVRTMPDTDDVMTGETDFSPRDAALPSGAQWLSTDYPRPDPTVNVTYCG